MKKETIITQIWWINEGENNIPIEHHEDLEVEGINRAIEMMKDNYTEGELHQSIENIQYNGYWSLTTKTL